MERVFKTKIKILSIIVIALFLIFIIFGQCFKDKEKSKIILIGLDGAEWSIINKLIAQGKLPNLAKLVKNGAYGDLKSIPPLLSPPIWMSIITGKNREEHGITGFFEKYSGQYDPIPTTSDRKVKALWNIFSENNRTVGIVNWWSSWPAEKVNGVIISNYPFCLTINMIEERRLLDSVEKPKITYPENITKEIISMADVSEDAVRQKVELILGLPLSNLDIKSEKERNFIKALFIGVKTEKGLGNIGQYVIEKIHPDFFAIYFRVLDAVQHIFWHYMDYNAPWKFKINTDEIEKFKEVIYNSYRLFDKIIEELLADIDENTTVIIVSDHGFRANIEAKEKNYSLNFIFEKLGWLKYRSDNPQEIDFSKTKVYDFDPQPWDPKRDLYINLKNRDPEGIVSKIEYDSFRSKIKETLEKIKTTNGELLIKECVISEITSTISKGRQPPDLIVTLNTSINYNENFKILEKTYSVDKIFMPTLFTGDHREYGVIIMSGKNIKKGIKIEGAGVLDIAPTILTLSGLPVAKDMDGKVLVAAIEDKFLQEKPITYISSYETDTQREIIDPENLLLKEYGKELKNRLKSLGYIQ